MTRAAARNEAIDKLARGRCGGSAGRRCGTFLTGILITRGHEGLLHRLRQAGRAASSISTGMLLGSIMFAQRVGRDLAQPEGRSSPTAANVLAGGEADARGGRGGPRRRSWRHGRTRVLGHDAVVHDVHVSTSPSAMTRRAAARPAPCTGCITLMILAVLEVNALGLIGGGFKPAKECRQLALRDGAQRADLAASGCGCIFWLIVRRSSSPVSPSAH